jgi:hypothetical protein
MARGIDLNSDVGIQERSRRRSGMCIQTALKMVNKDGMDEGGGLCSLCKGGCQDIPGMSLTPYRLATETRWLGSGRRDP